MGSLIMLVPFPNMNIFSNAMAIEEDSDKGNKDNNRYEEDYSDKGNYANNLPRYEEDYSDKGNYTNNLPRYEED